MKKHPLKTRLLLLRSRAWRWHGIPPNEFRRLTPAELAALDEDYAGEQRARAQAEDRRTARICATVANAAPRKKGAPGFTEDDFLPRASRRPQVNMPAEFLMQKAMMWQALFSRN